jgi:hypothetical protein
MSTVATSAVVATVVVAAAATAAPAAPGARHPEGQGAQAAVYAPRVNLMVVGRARMLRAPGPVISRPAVIAVAGRRCGLAGGTALAALEASRRLRGPAYRLRDYGSCSLSPANSASLFVNRIGPDPNLGRNGWVYKVGRRSASTGAADPTGPFGAGRRLRPGERVTWFYCRMGPTSCQRTLELTLAGPRFALRAPIRALVRGYDDAGRGVAVAGATVRLGPAVATTGRDGAATIVAPAAPGRYSIEAAAGGLVPAFPVGVTIG